MSDPNPSQPPQTVPPWSLTATATLCWVAALAPTVAAAYFLVTSSTARTGMEYAVSAAFLAVLALISLVFVLGARAIRQTGMLLAPRLLGIMLAIFGGVGTATTATRLADKGTGLVSVAVSALTLIAAVALLVLPHLAGGTAWAAQRRAYVEAKIAEAKRPAD